MKPERRSPAEFTTNHTAGKLSELDIQMIRTIPPGGNWKNIPESIPSKRLKQIRESYARGEGSRSTYYGRLRWDRPAYTISTYFNRPGNGCHIHPSEERLITVREAARLQSFPDWYHFYGTQVEVQKQVGNAVPPLLAYSVAKRLSIKTFVDLYCGAGGMSLGFEEAGAIPVLAVDIVPTFCETYKLNRGTKSPAMLIGDLSKDKTKENACEVVSENLGELDAVIGGPPCQGFSHAGNARTLSDPRNRCVLDFIDLVKRLKPRVAVMENVTGITTIRNGSFMGEVIRRFDEIGYPSSVTTLAANSFGIPQKRNRVFVIATDSSSDSLVSLEPSSPSPVTTVSDAISDLPAKPAKSPEEHVFYASSPASHYQEVLRGLATFEEYAARVLPTETRESRLVQARLGTRFGSRGSEA